VRISFADRLGGTAINAIWHVKWADPIAALAILPLIVWEGREDAFGSDYQEDEYTLFGMAIKYAGLRGKKCV
jgi:hypothetical protein